MLLSKTHSRSHSPPHPSIPTANIQNKTMAPTPKNKLTLGQKIINATFPHASKTLIKHAVKRFEDLRKTMQEDKGDLGKKISTSELIDWFNILRRYPEDEVLAQLNNQIPFPEVLLKSWEDHRRYIATNN